MTDGYPLAWDYDLEVEVGTFRLFPCSSEELRQYLDDCRNSCVDGASWRHPDPRMVSEHEDAERRLGLLEFVDNDGRDWWVVAGTGASPFVGDRGRHTARWVFSEVKPAGLSVADYVAKLVAELNGYARA